MQPLNGVGSFLLGVAILLTTIGPFITVAQKELLMANNSEKGPETKRARTELIVDKTSIDEGIGGNVATRRKMVSGEAVMGKAEAKDKSLGAKHPVGKCGHGGRKGSSVNCDFRSRKLLSGVYFDGHIPFTADYPRPQHHPPRNN